VLLLLLVLRLLFSRLHLPAAYFLAGASLCIVAADVAYFSRCLRTASSQADSSASPVVAYMLFSCGPAPVDAQDARPRPDRRGPAPRRLLVLLACAPLSVPAAIAFSRAVGRSSSS
jgi:hypothetical protein